MVPSVPGAFRRECAKTTISVISSGEVGLISPSTITGGACGVLPSSRLLTWGILAEQLDSRLRASPCLRPLLPLSLHY
jgi:hypothetical protein